MMKAKSFPGAKAACLYEYIYNLIAYSLAVAVAECMCVCVGVCLSKASNLYALHFAMCHIHRF